MPTKYGDRQVATSECFCVRWLRIAWARRQRSGWTNAKLCSLIVARLGAILKQHASEYQPILFLDALPAHLALPVMDSCARTGILPLVIPAGCTDILQPLDTHIFSCLKARLRELYAEAQQRCEEDVSMPAFIDCTGAAIAEILCGRDWSHSFVDNGFDIDQSRKSNRFAALGCGDAGGIDSSAVSLSQLELCLPARAQAAAAVIWRRFVSKCVVQDVAERKAPTAAARSLPHLGKTRSQTRAMASLA